MTDTEKMTAQNAPVGTCAEQPQNFTSDIISETNKDCNPETDYFAKMQIEVLNQMNPYYIKTVSMPELYDMVYQGKAPIIDGLLYPGTYLFVGSPKVGKSFMMAQLAYHVSSGTALWGYEVHKGTVLYLALEDDYKRLQARLYRMFSTEANNNLFFSVASKSLGQGLNEQLCGFINEHPDTNLIIIDTLQKVREADSDNYSYAKDYEIITQLRNENTLAWDLERVESELWREPPEPLLEEIAKLVTKENPHWIGNATELSQILSTNIPVNSLTKKMNVNAGRLLNDYQIRYRYIKNHDGRFLEFHFANSSP